MTATFEQGRGQTLVDHVVLGEQDAQSSLGQIGGQHRRGQRRPRRLVAGEGAADRAKQIALIDGLGQVIGDADLAASRGFAVLRPTS